MAKDQSWIADLLVGYKQINQSGVAIPRRNVLNLVSGLTATDNPNTGATDLVSSANAPTGWQTALDLDFTAETTQSLTTDGNYTIGGLTWTKALSSHDRVAMAVTNGTGLVITPTSGSAFNSGNSRSSPLLQLPLSQLSIPKLDWRMPLRVWIKLTSTSLSTNGDFFSAALGTLNSQASGENVIDSVLFWGQTSGAGGVFCAPYRSNAVATSNPSVVTLASTPVVVMEASILNTVIYSLYGGFGAGPAFPDPGTLNPGNPAIYTSANSNYATSGLGATVPALANMALLFSAQAADSSTAFTVQRLRVDYRP